jgi:hypothetical protein
MCRKKRHTYRVHSPRRVRGAAMVEASFVLGVMVVFWGLLQWTRQSYADKLDQMAVTRRDASFYSAHNCEEGQGASSKFGGTLDVGADDPTKKALPNLGGAKGADGAQEKVSRAQNMATASRQSKSVGFAQADLTADGTNTLQKVRLERTIKSESHVFCNEKPYDADPVSWVSFAGRFFKTGAGVF